MENAVGKGEIAHDKQFHLFPQRFLPFQRTFHHICKISNCCPQFLKVWKNLEFVPWKRVNRQLLVQDLLEVLTFSAVVSLGKAQMLVKPSELW